MTEEPGSVEQPGQASEPDRPDNIAIWSAWLEQAARAGSDVAQLLQLEVRLALGDAKRMLLLAILFLPVLMLAWIGFSCLLAWLVWHHAGSVTMGLLSFLLIQLLALTSIRAAWRHYRKSLSLPLTRQHLQAFMGDEPGETQMPDS